MELLLLSIISGILLGYSWISQGESLLITISFIPLLLMEYILKNKKNKKYNFFLYIYISFLIWHIISVWWIHYALQPDKSRYMWEAFIIPIMLNSLILSTIFYLYSKSKKILDKKKVKYF